MSTLKTHCDAVIRLIDRTERRAGRLLIGIAGPPGSGKSTLAEAVVAALNARAKEAHPAVSMPMDGFHLDNGELRARGLLQRKGAPETFDAKGLLKLLVKARSGIGGVRYPLFDRALDQSVADAGELKAETSIVVVEGNYLLLDEPVWREVADQFDATVFLGPSLATLESRLIERWLDHGFTAEAARQKAHGNDMVNARVVMEKSLSADLILAEPPAAACAR
jgi:pantothenate kinase